MPPCFRWNPAVAVADGTATPGGISMDDSDGTDGDEPVTLRARLAVDRNTHLSSSTGTARTMTERGDGRGA